MVCALVAFFSMINNIKVMAEELKICSDCPDGTTEPGKTKTTQDLDAQGNKIDSPNSEEGAAPPPPAYPNWLADMMAWFSGAKWFWDYQATPDSSEERLA